MKYVMLIGGIADMGGGQKYCANKVTELRKRGVETIVISMLPGRVLLEQLKIYENNVVIELRYPPRYYSKKQIQHILSKIEFITKKLTNDTVIDCSMPALAEWGELISHKYQCKNICFFIDEKYHTTTESIKFLDFKLNRSELYGTSIDIIPMIFEQYKYIEKKKELVFNPWCTNVVENIEYSFPENFDNSRVNVAFFGRLDKSYIKDSMVLSREFFLKHNRDQFNVFLIGGTDSIYRLDELVKLYSNLDNVATYVTGFMTPIPRKLLKSMDVCIATAGCARVADDEKIPTICVNTISGDPFGIIGYHIDKNSCDIRYGINDNVTMLGLLDDIIYMKYCEKNEPKYVYDVDNIEEEMIKEIDSEFMKINKNTIKEYYDVQNIKVVGKEEIISRIIIRLLGVNVLNKFIYDIWQKIKVNWR